MAATQWNVVPALVCVASCGKGVFWRMESVCFRLFHRTVQDNEFQIGANCVTWNDAPSLDVAFESLHSLTLQHFKAVSKMALANRDEQARQEPRLRWRHNINHAWKPVWTAGRPDRPSGFDPALLPAAEDQRLRTGSSHLTCAKTHMKCDALWSPVGVRRLSLCRLHPLCWRQLSKLHGNYRQVWLPRDVLTSYLKLVNLLMNHLPTTSWNVPMHAQTLLWGWLITVIKPVRESPPCQWLAKICFYAHNYML